MHNKKNKNKKIEMSNQDLNIKQKQYLTYCWLHFIKTNNMIKYINFKYICLISFSALLIFVLTGKLGVILWIFMMILLVPSAIIIKWLSYVLKNGKYKNIIGNIMKNKTTDNDNDNDDNDQEEKKM